MRPRGRAQEPRAYNAAPSASRKMEAVTQNWLVVSLMLLHFFGRAGVCVCVCVCVCARARVNFCVLLLRHVLGRYAAAVSRMLLSLGVGGWELEVEGWSVSLGPLQCFRWYEILVARVLVLLVTLHHPPSARRPSAPVLSARRFRRPLSFGYNAPPSNPKPDTRGP
jgi:hypothetical protein